LADSYFASVQAAIRLYSIGLRFIGTVKTATKEFPISYLGNCVMAEGRGDRRGLLSRNDTDPCSLLAYCWVDRDRRYFIATCSSLAPGNPAIRWRWTQVVPNSNVLPVFKECIVQQPQAAETYYNSCAKIDQHNKCRQAELMLERKVKTKEWWRRVSHSLVAMCCVDSYLLMVGCRGTRDNGFSTARHFFDKLAELLIDNTFEARNLRRRADRALAAANALAITTDEMLETHLQTIAPTPTKKRKKNNPNRMAQGLCMVCRKSATSVCRECQRYQPDTQCRQYFICNKPGKICMGIHITRCHPHAVRGNAHEGDEY
jgi:hypothetical protein